MEENPEDSKPLAHNSVKILDQHSLVKVMVKADWPSNKTRVGQAPLKVQRAKNSEAAGPCARATVFSISRGARARDHGRIAAVALKSGSSCEILTACPALEE